MPDQRANLFDGQMFIYDIKTKNIDPISKNFNPAIDNAQWSTFDNKIYVKCTDKDLEDIYCYDPSKKTYTKLPLEVDVVSSFHISKTLLNVLFAVPIVFYS